MLVGGAVATMMWLMPRCTSAFSHVRLRRHVQTGAWAPRGRPRASADDASDDLSLADIYHIDVREPHPRTIAVARRHCATFSRYAERTIHARHTVEAFQEASAFVDRFYASQTGAAVRHVVLDSGCGAGLSTYSLASLYPHMPVIGVDRSIARLSRNKRITIKAGDEAAEEDDIEEENDDDNNAGDGSDGVDGRVHARHFEKLPNAILLRAELSDFFLLACEASDWVVHSHYMLYPNPYPKAKHLQVCRDSSTLPSRNVSLTCDSLLKRRWHGHPTFPVILALGGKLIVRSNWDVYCAEMVAAVDAVVAEAMLPGLASCDTRQCTAHTSGAVGPTHSAGMDAVRTHFQNKYLGAGVPVFEASFNLGQRSLADRLKMLNREVNRT